MSRPTLLWLPSTPWHSEKVDTGPEKLWMAVGRGCLVQFLRCGLWVRGGGPFFPASPGGDTVGPWTLGYCGDEQWMDQVDRGPLNL